MAFSSKSALLITLAGLMVGCERPNSEIRFPGVVLASSVVIPDAGQDSGIADAGCIIAFMRGLPPEALESGADAISERGLVGGWVNANNSTLPALWLADGGLVVFGRDAGLISGRIRAFSAERGVGEVLMVGLPIQAAVFDVDGGVATLGGAPSIGRAGGLRAAGGSSRDNIALWGLDGELRRTQSRGAILGGDGLSRFVGRVDSAGGSFGVIVEEDGGMTPLRSQSRYSGAVSIGAGVVVGYEDVGELVPVRWEVHGGEPNRLPTTRGFGGAAFVDKTGCIVGSEWDGDLTRLNSALAWTPRGSLIELRPETNSVPLSFVASNSDGMIAGNCIIQGMTRACLYLRSAVCALQ